MSAPTFCTIILHWRDPRRAERPITDVPYVDSEGVPRADLLFDDLLEAHATDLLSIQMFEQTGCPGPNRLLRQYPEGLIRETVRHLVAEGAALPTRNPAGRGNEA